MKWLKRKIKRWLDDDEDILVTSNSAYGKTKKEINFVEDRKGHDFRYSVNWSKINHELHYKPTINFEEGLVQTITWYRENSSWWRPLKSGKGV